MCRNADGHDSAAFADRVLLECEPVGGTEATALDYLCEPTTDGSSHVRVTSGEKCAPQWGVLDQAVPTTSAW